MRQRLVFGLVGRLAQYVRCLGQQVADVRQTGRRQQLGVGHRCGAHGAPPAIVQPVAKLKVLAPDAVRVGPAVHIVHPARHAVVLLFQQARVAIAQVDRPRADHRCIAPHRRAAAPEHTGFALPVLGRRLRDEMGHAAVGLLVGAQVAQPLGVERRHVHVVARRSGKHLRVGRPSQALVALRAVGRHVHKVALLPPHDVVLQLVDHGVGALKSARRRRVRVQHDAGQGIQRRLAGQSLDRHVLKALEGKVRREHLVGVRRAFQDVARGLLGLAQVLGVQIAFLVQHLGMAQCDLGACRAARLHPHPADHVLAKVKDGLALGRLDDAHGADRLVAGHQRPGLRHQHVLAVVQQPHAVPVAVVIGGQVPSWLFQTRVIVLAHVNVGHPDRPGGSAPLRIAAHDLAAPVGVGDLQLQQQPRLLAVQVALGAQAHVPAVPSVAELRAQRIVALAHQRCHVVRLVLDDGFIAGPARRQHGVAHPLSVQPQLVQAEAGGIDARRSNVAARGKRAPQQGDRL